MMDPFQVAAKTGFKGIEFHFTYAWPANGAWPGCRAGRRNSAIPSAWPSTTPRPSAVS